MNPFTKTLLDQIDPLDMPLLSPFVAGWDTLEALVIDVFRAKGASPSHEALYLRLRNDLTAAYADWALHLAPYWQRARVKGRGKQKPQRATQDPFVYLLGFAQAGDFAKSRDAFLMLPAAREAINTFLLAQIEATKPDEHAGTASPKEKRQ